MTMGLLLCRGKKAPAIDWNLTAGLPTTCTFTRASAAWSFNSAGTLAPCAANTPRFDYNPTTLLLRGLLVEDQRTNLALQSSSVATSPWYTSGAAASNAATTGPDGTANSASSFTPTVLNGSINQAITVSGSTIYTFSVWLKQGTGNAANIKMQYYGGAYQASTITITSQWQRYSFTFTTPASPSTNTFSIVDSNASNWGSIYVYGAQVETGAFASSNIATTTTTATRAADMLAAPSVSWFNALSGAMTAEFIPAYVGTTNEMDWACLSDGTFNNQILALQSVASQEQLFIKNAGTSNGTAVANGAISASEVNKIGATWNASTYSISTNGATATSAAIVSGIPSAINKLSLGSRGDAGNKSFGWLRRFRYWPSALDAVTLQQITQ